MGFFRDQRLLTQIGKQLGLLSPVEALQYNGAGVIPVANTFVPPSVVFDVVNDPLTVTSDTAVDGSISAGDIIGTINAPEDGVYTVRTWFAAKFGATGGVMFKIRDAAATDVGDPLAMAYSYATNNVHLERNFVVRLKNGWEMCWEAQGAIAGSQVYTGIFATLCVGVS